MELIKENLELSEIKHKNSSLAYVDGDIIVPDVKPDILKVLQVDAVSRIDDKEITDGEIKIGGTVKYNILYVPDGNGENIKSIGYQMEFSHTIDKSSALGDVIPQISCDVERVEFNLLNSRKLNIKTAVGIDCVCWGKKEIEISKSIEDEKFEAIYENIRAEKIDVFEECNVVICDKLEIPANVPGILEILKMDISISDREIKAITGKAVIKGNVSMCVLYLDTEKNIRSIDAEIPFTEIAEIFDLEEDARCDVEYRLGEYTYDISLDNDGEARCVDFEISVDAQIISKSCEEFEVMSDCFCPGKPVGAIYDRVSVERVISSKTCQNTIKDVVSVDKKAPGIASVYNVILRPVIQKSQTENGKVILEGKAEIYVLYITDNAQMPIHCLKKDVPINIRVDMEDARSGMNCNVKIVPEHTAYNLNMANEVEVRCVLSADISLIEKSEIPMITGIERKDREDECGIVIYFVKSGDTLWKIAKRYSVSIDSIKELNNLEDKNTINVGDRLIIPAC